MVTTSGRQPFPASSMYPAGRRCAFGAVRSYCSLHIVTVLTENQIILCICAYKAAYKQPIWQLLVHTNVYMYSPYTWTAVGVRLVRSEVIVRYIL